MSDYLLDSVRLFQSGKTLDAYRFCRRALALDPTKAEAWGFIVSLASAAGFESAALQAATRSTRLSPMQTDLLSAAASAYAKFGHFADAVCFQKRIICASPWHDMHWLRLSEWAFTALQFDVAESAANKVIRLGANIHQGLSALADVAYRQDQFLDAERYLKKVLCLQPVDPSSLTRLGLVGERIGVSTRAVSHCKRAVMLMPDVAEYHYNLGCVSSSAGDSSLAIESFVDCLRRDRFHLAARNNLGNMRRGS